MSSVASRPSSSSRRRRGGRKPEAEPAPTVEQVAGPDPSEEEKKSEEAESAGIEAVATAGAGAEVGAGTEESVAAPATAESDSGTRDVVATEIRDLKGRVKQMLKEKRGNGDKEMLECMTRLADLVNVQGYHNEDMYRDLLARQISGLSKFHPDTVDTMMKLAKIVLQVGRIQEASEIAKGALKVARKNFPIAHERCLAAQKLFADTLSAGKRPDAAEAMHREIVRFLVDDEADIAKIAAARNNVAVCLQMQGKVDDAMDEASATLEMQRKHMEPEAVEIFMTLFNIASLQLLQRRPGKAKKTAQTTLAGFLKHYPDDHPMVSRCRILLKQIGDVEDIYRVHGRPEKRHVLDTTA